MPPEQNISVFLFQTSFFSERLIILKENFVIEIPHFILHFTKNETIWANNKT